MHYPLIDPIIFSLGPLAVRWYGLSYVVGFGMVWWLGKRRLQKHLSWTENQLSDLVFHDSRKSLQELFPASTVVYEQSLGGFSLVSRDGDVQYILANDHARTSRKSRDLLVTLS